MPATLPSGLTARRPTTDDAAGIFAVVAAYNTHAVGDPDYTLEDIEDELVEPGFDPDTDGWVIQDDTDGHLVGWGWAMRKGDSDSVDLGVYTHGVDPAVAVWLWDAAETRAAELAGAAGHPQAVVDTVVYRQEADLSAALQARGYAVAAIFNRLRIDHSGPVDHPALPDGVTLRNASGSAGTLRDAHAVHTASFDGHFGFVPETYEQWYERLDAASTNDWALTDVAYADGVPAAVLRRTNAFVESDNCGYVHVLAVHPAFQGRGLGRLLLRHAFAADAALGHAGTLLHVDTDPARPALNLYLSVGMRPVRVMDVHRKTIDSTIRHVEFSPAP